MRSPDDPVWTIARKLGCTTRVVFLKAYNTTIQDELETIRGVSVRRDHALYMQEGKIPEYVQNYCNRTLTKEQSS